MFDVTMTDKEFKREFVNQNEAWLQNSRPAEPDLEVEGLTVRGRAAQGHDDEVARDGVRREVQVQGRERRRCHRRSKPVDNDHPVWALRREPCQPG